MRTTVKRLGVTLGLAALVALAPAAAASASSGGGGITVPTGPGGPPTRFPIPDPQRGFSIYFDGNSSGCLLVLTHNELINGTYTGVPLPVIDNGTKIKAHSSDLTAPMSDVIDYAVTCVPLSPAGTIVGQPVDQLEFRFSAPTVGPPFLSARTQTGFLTVNTLNFNTIGQSVGLTMTVS